MYFQWFIKLGSVFLGLSLISTSLYATQQLEVNTTAKTEVNATYIYLPKIPKIEVTTPVAQKAVKVLPVITVTPKEDKVKSVSQQESTEDQKIKATNQEK